MKLKSNFGFEPTFVMLEEAYSCSYDKEQRDILRLGFENGVDIHKYANPKLDWTYMNRIRQALEKGIDISKCVKSEYVPQFIEIIYTVAVCSGTIEQFIERDNKLDVESILDEYDHQMRLHDFEPLDDVIREAIIVLGPYYVNE
jgi:hypothetical protein